MFGILFKVHGLFRKSGKYYIEYWKLVLAIVNINFGILCDIGRTLLWDIGYCLPPCVQEMTCFIPAYSPSQGPCCDGNTCRFIRRSANFVCENTQPCMDELYCEYPLNLYKNEPPNDKTNKVACAPSEDTDQPGHPPALIRVFAVRMKKSWVLSYLLSAQRRLWSDWADAQADLSLRWAHSHFVGFVMRRLK